MNNIGNTLSAVRDGATTVDSITGMGVERCNISNPLQEAQVTLITSILFQGHSGTLDLEHECFQNLGASKKERASALNQVIALPSKCLRDKKIVDLLRPFKELEFTPLCLAAFLGNVNIVTTLMSKGAKLNIRGAHIRGGAIAASGLIEPFFCALEGRHFKIAEMLLQGAKDLSNLQPTVRMRYKLILQERFPHLYREEIEVQDSLGGLAPPLQNLEEQIMANGLVDYKSVMPKRF